MALYEDEYMAIYSLSRVRSMVSKGEDVDRSHSKVHQCMKHQPLLAPICSVTCPNSIHMSFFLYSCSKPRLDNPAGSLRRHAELMRSLLGPLAGDPPWGKSTVRPRQHRRQVASEQSRLSPPVGSEQAYAIPFYRSIGI